MVNINYEISDELHRKAKSKAAITGITLKELIIKAINKEVNKNG